MPSLSGMINCGIISSPNICNKLISITLQIACNDRSLTSIPKESSNSSIIDSLIRKKKGNDYISVFRFFAYEKWLICNQLPE